MGEGQLIEKKRCAVHLASLRYVPPLVAFMLPDNAATVSGTWVSGDLSLFEDRVRFDPVGGRRPGGAQMPPVEILFCDVTRLDWRSGVIAGAIDITHGRTRSTFRCSGTRPLAAAVGAAIEHFRTAAAT